MDSVIVSSDFRLAACGHSKGWRAVFYRDQQVTYPCKPCYETIFLARWRQGHGKDGMVPFGTVNLGQYAHYTLDLHGCG